VTGKLSDVSRSFFFPVCVPQHGPVAAIYEGVSKSFRTGHLERKLQMVQLSATRCSCIAISWVSLVSFAIINLCVASQLVFIVVYFIIDSVRKVLDTHSYALSNLSLTICLVMDGWLRQE
jgi:hypothetical protein